MRKHFLAENNTQKQIITMEMQPLDYDRAISGNEERFVLRIMK